MEVPGEVDPGNHYPYQWFPCCGYYRQLPIVPEEKLHALYDADYHAFRHRGAGLLLYRWIMKKRAGRFRHLVHGKDILEIGCGTGDFLRAARRWHPASTLGIELSPHAAAIANEIPGVTVLCGSVDAAEPDRKFDAIFMFHVIEHLVDPESTLRKCKHMLKDGGTLILETPNAMSLDRSYFGLAWAGFSAPFHTFVFSPASAMAMLERTGYVNSRVRYHPLTNTFSSIPRFALQKGPKWRRILDSIHFLAALPLVSRRKKSGIITVTAKSSP